MQRLREAERDIVFEEYIDKEGEVLTATIQRVEPRWVTVDLGKAEAIMPPAEQSPFERYRPGQLSNSGITVPSRTIITGRPVLVWYSLVGSIPSN